MTTKRKPYIREMKPSWWKELGFYKFYIVRESTSLASVWFSLVLLYGVYALGHNEVDNFVGFLQNPIVLLLNVITLVATLFHAKTWFELAPKAVNLIRNGEKISSSFMVRTLWIITVVVALVILALVLL